MNEAGASRPPAVPPSAGRLLREAREKQGLHIAALAAAIKVSPKKLEMLESDRFDELPDATFTRALANTVCRALKTDAAPVMRLLPAPSGHRLEHVGEGLNTPFRDRSGALVQRDWRQVAASPVFWAIVVVLGAAAVVYFLPSQLARPNAVPATPASAPTAAVVPAGPPQAAPNPLVPVLAAAPAPAVASPPVASTSALPVATAPRGAPLEPPTAPPTAPIAAPVAATPPAGVLQLRTSAASWVEVTDGRGQPLIARLLQPGESINVDGTPPFRLRIGNAAATRLVFRGQATELQAFTRDNVARLELR